MARKSAVYDFFDENDKKFVCKVENEEGLCGVELVSSRSGGGNSGNLKRHLERLHPKQFEEVESRDAAKRKKNGQGQRSIIGCFPSVPVTANILTKKEDFLTGIIQMVVYDGLSLRFFSGKGFKTICGAAAEKFGVRLDKDNIRDLVMTKAKLQRTELTKELEGKYVYLKFDGATRLRAHFLGVNVQYWSNDGGLKVKTLALVDTQAQHGSESLKTLVLQTMQRFNIPLYRGGGGK